MRKYLWIAFFISLVPLIVGCSTTADYGDDSMVYKVFSPEPEWIRNGEPIEFEGELWYPRDSVDILMDSEVLPLGEYRGVPFYLQKIDVRPFEYLYTKFGKNKFRVFEVKKSNDSSQRAF